MTIQSATAVPPRCIDPVSQRLMAQQTARKGLASTLQVEAEAIQVKGMRNQFFSNGSLGFPVRGSNYTDAAVPGWVVTLEHDGDKYECHSGGGRTLYGKMPRDGAPVQYWKQDKKGVFVAEDT